jgi:hypothetical protein
MVVVRFLVQAGGFLVGTASRSAPRNARPHIHLVQELKVPGIEAMTPPSLLLSVKNAWSHCSTPPLAFVVSYCRVYIVTYFGMCVTYRRSLDWWPDLFGTYATCYYVSQTRYVFSSPSSSTAISRDSLNSTLSCLRSSLYSPGAALTENAVS